MEPVTPSEKVEPGLEDEPTSVVGDDTGMVRPDFDLRPGTTLGEYEIVGALGGGGMGEVFAAIHPKIGKRVAIKVLKKDLSDPFHVQRFSDEAKVVNTIGHPNIVDIFGFGEMPDGRCYFVMELLVGETLRERIARGRLPIDEVGALLRPLTRALDAAHGKGVIHRDLKPDNVFLVAVPGERPTVKLLDFGIAKLAKTDHRIEQTKSGVIVGTPQYIAPEQAKGREIDGRADIYALGGIVFEMLTGRTPFEADNAMEMVAKHLMEPPPHPSTIVPGIPPELDALVVAMLAKEPAQRPPLGEVMRQLDQVTAGFEDRETLEPTPRRRAASPVALMPSAPITPPPPPPLTPPPIPSETLSGFVGEPISGAHTAVEPIVEPLGDPLAPPLTASTEVSVIGKGRGVWIAVSVVVLGIAMILSFVLIKVLRGEAPAPDAAIVATSEDAPVAIPIEPDAAPADASVIEPDAAAVRPSPPDAGMPRPSPPDAGVARPIMRPQPPPPRPRGRLILDVLNAGKTLEIVVGKRRFTTSRVEAELPLDQPTAVLIRSAGRFDSAITVRATPSTPVVRQLIRLKVLDTMEPGGK